MALRDVRTEVDLVRDVLDEQLLDREGRAMGKADGITAELREGEPPRLVSIEQGGPVPWRRLSSPLGDLAARLGARWSVRGGKAYSIPWDKIMSVGINVELDVENAYKTPALAWELWLRDHIVGRILGGK